MKKSILIGLGLAVSVASTAIAQNQDTTRMRGAKAGRGQFGQMEGRRGKGGPDGLLLKGITLTEGQRTQIAQLAKTQRDKFEANREKKRGERAQHIAAIRNILTAEQRVQFDKNVAELQAREAERVQRVGERGQPGERGGRGPKGGRGQFRAGR